MERVSRFAMGRDVIVFDRLGNHESGTPEFHVDVWFVGEDGRERHRAKSFPEDSTLADILKEIPDYEEWAE